MSDIIIYLFIVITLGLIMFLDGIICYYWGRNDGYNIAYESKFEGEIKE